MDAMPPPDLDRLLADTAFVRRIARSLVRDPDAAEDLAQDALVVALERPPHAGTSLRGWIATVVRSLAVDRARSASARLRREASAPAPEPAPGPDEIATRLDLSQRIAGALRELEEPYRTALYLRYVEELDPPAIAERLDLPLATVKTQLRRGLETLRRRFDREWGGREAWSAALMPLAGEFARSAPIAGTLIMSTTTKIAAALLVCGAAAWVLWPSDTTVGPVGAPTIASASDADLAAPERERGERKVAAATDARAAGTAVADPSTSRAGPFVRVLDERRFPVAGAHVRLHVPGFGDDETTSDADGIARFFEIADLEAVDRQGVSLLAWDDLGRVGARGCSSSAVDALDPNGPARALRDQGEIVLGPGAAVTVRVEDGGRPAPGARVSLELGAQRHPSFAATVDAEGRVRFPHVPAKSVVARAEHELHAGRATRILSAGEDAVLIVVLVPTRPVELTVVEKTSREPIAGARVTLSESFMVTQDDVALGGGTFGSALPIALDVPPTGADGRTRIVGLPDQGEYGLRVTADLHMGPMPPGGFPSIRGSTGVLTVELESLRERTARWPIVAGEVEPPPGTELSVRNEMISEYVSENYAPPPSRARIEDGHVVADGVRDRMYGLLAVASDGSIANLWIADGADVGRPTSFFRPRRVDVRVLAADGTPARAIEVELRNGGNNLLAPLATTDERGEVSFDGLYASRVVGFARGHELGDADLARGDGRIDARLPAWHELTVRLRIDGEPRLPPAYEIWIGNGTRVVSEDPGAALVRVAYLTSGEKPSVGVRAPGFLSAGSPFDPSSSDVVDLDLRRGGALLAHVQPPRSGRVRLRCERWDPVKERWQTGSAHQVRDERFTPNAPDGGYLFGGLAPGRYRVRDVDAERSSEGVDVAGGGATSEVELDLSMLVRVRGVIETPAGVPGWLAHVVVEGEGIASHESTWLRGTETEEGHYADKDGRFSVIVDATRPVTLRAVHPYLSPDPERGSLVVRGDAQDVRLALVAGDEVQIPMKAFPDPSRYFLRVYAYSGEPDGEPHACFRALVVDGVARFSGLARGTWTLWIDPARTTAPIVMRGVEVGEGITRVEPELVAGSTLRVRLLRAAGVAAPHVYVSAYKKAEPTLHRDRSSEGEEVAVVTGIGVGTFRVSVRIGEREPVERTIDFDGLTDVEIEFDTRDPKRP